MKAPEWVIEMMKTGEPVKCMVWDGEGLHKRKLTVSAYGIDSKLKYFSDDESDVGEWFESAEPIKPPTIRPFRTVEEVEPYFGKVVKSGSSAMMITGATLGVNDVIWIYSGSSCNKAEKMLDYTFSDGSPVGIAE